MDTRPNAVSLNLDEKGDVQSVTVDGKEFIPKQKTDREMINAINRKLPDMKASIKILADTFNALNKRIQNLEQEQRGREIYGCKQNERRDG